MTSNPQPRIVPQPTPQPIQPPIQPLPVVEQHIHHVQPEVFEHEEKELEKDLDDEINIELEKLNLNTFEN